MELAQALTLEKGGGLLSCRAMELSPEDGGQVLEVTLRLRGVRPDRWIAVAVTLDERDGAGELHPRGMRVLALPAWHGQGLRDVEVPPIRFALPAGLDLGGGGPRRLIVRADAHYIDRADACPLAQPAE